jgi:hypothetical protein
VREQRPLFQTGPDQDIFEDEYDFTLCDATNGAQSNGNIWRWGP